MFWSDTCLLELSKSYVQFQSLLFSSKVLCSVPKSYVQVAKSYVQVAKSSARVAKSYVQVAKSYVQVAKFSSSVFL